MWCARVLAHCRTRKGARPNDGENLWVCVSLDADLAETGRSVVAIGPAVLSIGQLVHLARTNADPRGFDLIVAGVTADLGAGERAPSGGTTRVWLGEGRPRRASGQPQNHH